jgi:hypothetical protein
MKKRLSIVLIPALILCIFSTPTGALAGPKADQYLGEPEMCIDVHRIKETRIIDNQTILFIMRGGTRYLNRLPVPCTGLVIGDGFAYSTSISKLCMQDSIDVLNTGSALGNTCPLGKFLPFKADMRDSKAVKLLKEGLLDELVSEGTFEETFDQ